ncbi:MAG: glycosyltransferase [Bacteroidales bacterium]|nr:glycosyltransferase [Bacteroidales bacterium]MBN2633023.1 glycosyltransferase [Bacteroidales bacterium]
MFREDLIFLILFVSFVLAAAIQLYYYLWFYLPVWWYKHPESKESAKGVSVIICARNESGNLREFLPSILEQDYPDFEVIVVNDCSEDDSYNVLGEYLKKYPNLKVSNVNKDPKFAHNKKFAQFIGIKAAVNEILLFTDADCKPESDKWIALMASRFGEGTGFVLGYGGYVKGRGILNKWIRYDSMTIAMQYLGMAIRGRPYMGVGRNLAYLRRIFFENRGYGSHNHVISGDDDLFINSHARGDNTCPEFRPASHTRSVPSSAFRDWIKQKKRHLTTAPYYRKNAKFLILAEPVTRVIFYATFAILMSYIYLWPWLLAIFIIRLTCLITVSALVQKRLNEPGLAGFIPIFDIFSPFVIGSLIIGNMVKKPGRNQWK